MNASQSRFNQSQSQMRKTNQTNPGEFGSSNLGKLTQTGANFGATNSANAATLKGKLQSLEEQIQSVADEMNGHKKDVTSLQEKLQDEQDKYYKQFSSMETALTKLQSQQTYISQLFGGS